MGQNWTGLKQNQQEGKVGHIEEGYLHHNLTVLPAYQQQPRRWPTQQTKPKPDVKINIQSHLIEPQQQYLKNLENSIKNNNNSIDYYSLSKYQSIQSEHKKKPKAPLGPVWLYSYPKPLSLLSPYPSLEFHYLDPQTLPLQPVSVNLEVNFVVKDPNMIMIT